MKEFRARLHALRKRWLQLAQCNELIAAAEEKERMAHKRKHAAVVAAKSKLEHLMVLSKLRYHLFIVASFFFLLALRCTPNSAHTNLKAHNSINKHACTETMNDSLKLFYSQDTRRSKQVVSAKLSDHLKEFEDFISFQDTVFKYSDSAKISLSISTNGKVLNISKKTDFNLDSLSSSQFNKILNNIQFDSIPKYPLVVRTTLWAKKVNSNKAIVLFGDSINYFPCRTKASIMKVTMANLGFLRYAYQMRLREKSGLRGKITVKYAIDEYGKVIFTKVIESTVCDKILEKAVEDKIKNWIYCPIDNPGDVTEVIYPFIFSQ